jgi:hypothetical protein
MPCALCGIQAARKTMLLWRRFRPLLPIALTLSMLKVLGTDLHNLDSNFEMQVATVDFAHVSGSQTSALLVREYQRVVKSLREKSMAVIGTCTDGAANVASAMREYVSQCKPPQHWLWSLAHRLNLFVKCVTESVLQWQHHEEGQGSTRVFEAIELVVKKIKSCAVLADQCVKECKALQLTPYKLKMRAEMRWSSLFDCMARFVVQERAIERVITWGVGHTDHFNDVNVSFDAMPSVALLLTEALEPVKVLTMQVQGTSSSSAPLACVQHAVACLYRCAGDSRYDQALSELSSSTNRALSSPSSSSSSLSSSATMPFSLEDVEEEEEERERVEQTTAIRLEQERRRSPKDACRSPPNDNLMPHLLLNLLEINELHGPI